MGASAPLDSPTSIMSRARGGITPLEANATCSDSPSRTIWVACPTVPRTNLLPMESDAVCRPATGGTPLVAGLQTASDSIGSKLVRGTVGQATQMVREGESLHVALASKGVMPPLALDMIEVGESSGALAPMLTSVAEFYEDEVNLRLGAMVSLIEPAILIFMGLLVAFILISLYLPIFSISVTGTSGAS